MMSCPYRCVDGYVLVTDAYVTAELTKLPVQADDEVRRSREAVLRNTVSPCSFCSPELYDLWRGGHLDSGHSCDECIARRTKRSGRAKAAAK